MSVSDIPTLNAVLNGLATILLTAGFFFIRARRVKPHRMCMGSAFIVSVVFLFGYVTHKILVRSVHTVFEGEGPFRVIYYAMLLTHIILAMVMVPLILRTLYLALAGKLEQHRKWARWTFPIWAYVSVTGVLIYLFLYVWFQPVAVGAIR